MYQGQTALITGASSGIGEVFAHELAQRGSHLVLVARSEEKLRALADDLTARHSVRVEVIVADLSREGAAREVADACAQRGLVIDLLINNAGFATYNRFDQGPFARKHAEVMLNVVAVVDLTHHLLPAMLERRRGGVINVASTAGFQPVPYMAVYGATKAFVLSFSEALWAEYRGTGVRVLALCPGPVETPFFDAVGSREPAVGVMNTPENVVLTGLNAFEQGKNYIIPGWQTYLLAQVSRFFPRAWVALIAKSMFTPKGKA
jgi:hypothetical protein